MQKYQWYILLGIIALLLVNNGSIPFWDQDEAAYAGFAYQMNETGNWQFHKFDEHNKRKFSKKRNDHYFTQLVLWQVGNCMNFRPVNYLPM
jgi:hypothetical protein